MDTQCTTMPQIMLPNQSQSTLIHTPVQQVHIRVPNYFWRTVLRWLKWLQWTWLPDPISEPNSNANGIDLIGAVDMCIRNAIFLITDNWGPDSDVWTRSLILIWQGPFRLDNLAYVQCVVPEVICTPHGGTRKFRGVGSLKAIFFRGVGGSTEQQNWPLELMKRAEGRRTDLAIL